MTIYHFYHIYAGKNWPKAVQEHCNALITSGLNDCLDKMFIGLVGPSSERLNVKKYLDSVDISYDLMFEKDSGWEQETLNELYKFSFDNEGKVLYAHSKGAVHWSEHNDKWRLGMIQYNIGLWKLNIERLDTYDAVGVWWRPHQPFHYFEGNFWWTKLDIIRQLGSPRMDDRYWAECWIGTSGITNVYDLVRDFVY